MLGTGDVTAGTYTAAAVLSGMCIESTTPPSAESRDASPSFPQFQQQS